MIRFTHNWNNKLNSNYFTTIRLHNPYKYRTGDIHDVLLNNRIIGSVQIVSIKTLRGDQLDAFTCALDTGYCRTETLSILERIYKNININTHLFDIILCKRINGPSETKNLFTDINENSIIRK